MSKFQSWQRVVCIRKGGIFWTGVDNYGNLCGGTGPAFNEIVTVKKYSNFHKNCIELNEYQRPETGFTLPSCYDERWFEPLSEINELTDILEIEPNHESV